MALDLATGVVDLVTSAVNGATPIINNVLAQKYENDSKDRSNKWDEILAMPNDEKRASAVGDHVHKLLALAQIPTGDVGDETIATPVESFDQLVNIANLYVKTLQILASIQFKK